MGQPWGLSSPEFLWLYAGGFVAVIIIRGLVKRVFRRMGGAIAVRELDPVEAGYLAAGPGRAAHVVIAELAGSGAVRVDSTGQLSIADPATLTASRSVFAHGISCVDIVNPMSTSGLATLVTKDPGMDRIGQRLCADGYIISRERKRQLRIAMLLPVLALFTAGVLRLVEGAHNHRPVGLLVLFLILTGVFLLVSIFSTPDLTTLGGTRYLRQLKSAQKAGFAAPVTSPAYLPGAVFGAPTVLAEGALFGVALAGFAAVEDTALRTALLAGMPTSSGGSSCSSGGGCGGGCGGGGCGG
jgi:uncharacterized protein (TIGR04222 family)